jgi:hypothetical protein
MLTTTYLMSEHKTQQCKIGSSLIILSISTAQTFNMILPVLPIGILITRCRNDDD